MIELSKHIEKLLLKHNCVIVPQLGGFIAQDVPARYVAEEGLFLPPHRTVGFNPQLTLNDGLLVQSYMQTYDTNYPETIKLIDEAVANLKSEIQENGNVELNGIGTLSLNIDGLYDFCPNEAGILSPALYGLDTVSVALQNTQPAKKTSGKILQKQNGKKEEQNYNISINKEFVNYVAAAVVAIFFYFVWATPITENNSLTAQQASVLFPHHVQRLVEEIPSSTPVRSEELSAKEEISTAEKTAVTPECNYTIVLISCIPQRNAEKFAEELKADGLEEVSILTKRNLIRVVHGAYATESDAYTELNKLRNKSHRFKDAWILNNK